MFREFKADAIRRNMNLGAALTFAMEKFRSELKLKKARFIV